MPPETTALQLALAKVRQPLSGARTLAIRFFFAAFDSRMAVPAPSDTFSSHCAKQQREVLEKTLGQRIEGTDGGSPHLQKPDPGVGSSRPPKQPQQRRLAGTPKVR